MRDHLLRFIRRAPRTSQQCRDEMHSLKASSIETEALLRELRDHGEIAFANGAWYVPDSERVARSRKPASEDKRQLKLF